MIDRAGSNQTSFKGSGFRSGPWQREHVNIGSMLFVGLVFIRFNPVIPFRNKTNVYYKFIIIHL